MTPAREPTWLVARWRRAEAEASAWYWDHFGRNAAANHGAFASTLHDLKMADAERHARLLAAIAALDLACAYERPEKIAAAGNVVVREWKMVVAFMRQHIAEAAQ